MPTKSRGHVCFSNGWEYFTDEDGLLYRVLIGNPLNGMGFRMGARFECQPRADGHRQYLKDAYGITIP